MCDRGFRFGAADVICSPPGSSSSGELLHGGALNTNPFENFPGAHSVMRSFSVNGRLLTPKINVAWQLTDVGPEDGGFVSASKSLLVVSPADGDHPSSQVVMPGTHRANLPLPSNTLDDETMFEHAVHVEMAAGDVLFFMGGAGAAQTIACASISLR